MLNKKKTNVGLQRFRAPDIKVETMGMRIKALRLSNGMTQDQLALKVGVTKSAVSQWENGETANIKLTTFVRLFQSLDVGFEDLIFGDIAARVAQVNGNRAVRADR